MDTKHKFHKKILIICYLLFSIFCKSQDVKILLTIDFKKEFNTFESRYLNSKNSKGIPYLRISYTNISDKSYYFKNVLINNKNYAPVGISVVTCLDKYNCDNINKIKNKKLNFVILNNDDFLNEFMLYADTTNKKLSENNYNFSVLRNLFKAQNMLDKSNLGEKLKYFKITNKKTINIKKLNMYMLNEIDSSLLVEKNDFNDFNILNKFKNKFVFLKPNETKEFEVNLIQFLLLGGNYHFSIDKNVLSGKFSILNFDDEKVKVEIIQLPQFIDGYKLFDGKLISNTIFQKF